MSAADCLRARAACKACAELGLFGTCFSAAHSPPHTVCSQTDALHYFRPFFLEPFGSALAWGALCSRESCHQAPVGPLWRAAANWRPASRESRAPVCGAQLGRSDSDSKSESESESDSDSQAPHVQRGNGRLELQPEVCGRLLAASLRPAAQVAQAASSERQRPAPRGRPQSSSGL